MARSIGGKPEVFPLWVAPHPGYDNTIRYLGAGLPGPLSRVGTLRVTAYGQFVPLLYDCPGEKTGFSLPAPITFLNGVAQWASGTTCSIAVHPLTFLATVVLGS